MEILAVYSRLDGQLNCLSLPTSFSLCHQVDRWYLCVPAILEWRILDKPWYDCVTIYFSVIINQLTFLGSSLEGNSNISQLTMVPLQNTHAANGVIEPDRMLLVSGALVDTTFGIASSALFDGSMFIPYIMSSSASGGSGFISSLFSSLSSFSFTQHRECIFQVFASPADVTK